METWLTLPVKVLLTGLLLAMIVTFTWHDVQIQTVNQAAIVAANTAANSGATSLGGVTHAAQDAVDQMISNRGNASNLQTSISFKNDLVTAIVRYNPENMFANVFSYLGVPTLNQPITLTASARAKHTVMALQSVMPNLQLYTNGTSPAVANVISGYEEEIIGNLSFAGRPIANANISISVTGGTIGQATANPTGGATSTMDGGAITLAAPSTGPVTTNVPATTILSLQTDSNGNFAFDYYAPNMIGQFSITASGANATETISVGSTPIVTVANIANTYVNGSTTISGNVLTSAGSPVVDQPVTLDITLPDGTTQQINAGMTDSSGNFSSTYSPAELGGFMVKAECQGGVSNLYGEMKNISYNDVSLQTNINASNATPYNSSGDAQLWDYYGWPFLSASNPLINLPNEITYSAGDYLQANYPIPSGYQGFDVYSNISDNMNGTADGTTLYMSAVTASGSQQTDTINTPYGFTSQSVDWLLPNQTTSVNLGWEFTQSQMGNGWMANFMSQILISPTGSIVFGGTFDSQYVTMTEPQWPSSPAPSLGQPITVTGKVTYNGQPVANQTVTASQWYYYQSLGQSPTYENVLNSSGQSVSSLTTTTDANGNYSFTFIYPSSNPSGDYYGFNVTCDQSGSGAPQIALH